jgi:hypothetical protein
MQARQIWKRMEDFWRQRAFMPQRNMRTLGELRAIGLPPTVSSKKDARV